MKTTVELPEDLLRSAKSLAAKRGLSLKNLIIEALKRVIAEVPTVHASPEWLRCFGSFSESKDETAAIQAVVDTDLSKINPDEWK